MSLKSLTCDYLAKNIPPQIIDELIKKAKESPIKYDVVLYPVLPSREHFIRPIINIFLPDMEVIRNVISFLIKYYDHFGINGQQWNYFEACKTEILHLIDKVTNFKDLLQFAYDSDDMDNCWEIYDFIRTMIVYYHNFGFTQNAELISFINEHHYEEYFNIVEVEKYSYILIESVNYQLRYKIEKQIDNIKFDTTFSDYIVRPLKIYQVL